MDEERVLDEALLAAEKDDLERRVGGRRQHLVGDERTVEVQRRARDRRYAQRRTLAVRVAVAQADLLTPHDAHRTVVENEQNLVHD